jgi:hypothetical protein
MKNVELVVSGDVLHIKINLKAPTAESKSGKSLVIGTTEGNVSVPGHPEIKLGINCYKSK